MEVLGESYFDEWFSFLLALRNASHEITQSLTLSWRRPLSYRNHSIDLQSKSVDWFLYDSDLHHERAKMAILQDLVIEYEISELLFFIKNNEI